MPLDLPCRQTPARHTVLRMFVKHMLWSPLLGFGLKVRAQRNTSVVLMRAAILMAGEVAVVSA